jgi:hypothetical protein
MVLRRISGIQVDITGDLRKFHNEKLHNLFSSKYIIMTIKLWVEGKSGTACGMYENFMWV